MKQAWRSIVFLMISLGLLSTAAWAGQPTIEWAVSAGYPGTPSKVLADAQGNVYVTGSTYSANTNVATSTADMLTAKYDSNGIKLWETTYNSPLNGGFDGGYNLVLDTAGNVYVGANSHTSPAYYLGICATVVKYSPSGEQLWATRYADSAFGSHYSGLDIDAAGNVYLVLTTIYDAAYNSTAIDGVIVKYDSNGNRVWKYLMAIGHYGDDWASKVMVKNGFVYASGTFNGGDHGYGNNMRNSMVWKFTLDGQLVWKAIHDGGGADYSYDFTVDEQGNVYIASMSDRLLTGTTMWNTYLFDMATAKFNANGQRIWNSRYNNNGAGNHNPAAIAVDAVGDVYVLGSSDGDGTTGKDLATVKYRGTDGAQLWVDRYNGTANGDDTAGTLLVDNKGDVYVAGTSLNFSTGLDFTTIKYTPEGIRQWNQLYNGTANGSDTFASMALDANNDVYVTGTSNDANAIPQFLTVKYTLDKTPPAVNAGPDVTIEAVGPGGAPFTLTPKVTDNSSDIHVVIAPLLANYPLGTTIITVTATDAAGNVGSGTMSLTVVDTTPPTLNVPAAIHVQLNTLSSAPTVQAFLAAATAIDLVDANITFTYQVPALNSVGPKTVIFTATDRSGNRVTATSTIWVDYVFSGFLAPVNLGKPFKLGSTVPVKFELNNSTGEVVTTAVATLQLQKLSNNEPVGDPILVTSTSSADDGNRFRFSDGAYIFNLSTNNLQIGTYQMQVLLDDGSTKVIALSIK